MGDNHADNGQRRRGEQCTNTDCQQLRIRFNGMTAHAAVATTRPSPTSSTRRCRRDRRDTHRTTFSFLCKHAYTQRQNTHASWRVLLLLPPSFFPHARSRRHRRHRRHIGAPAAAAPPPSSSFSFAAVLAAARRATSLVGLPMPWASTRCGNHDAAAWARLAPPPCHSPPKAASTQWNPRRKIMSPITIIGE